jgi:hypothetical protein
MWRLKQIAWLPCEHPNNKHILWTITTYISNMRQVRALNKNYVTLWIADIASTSMYRYPFTTAKTHVQQHTFTRFSGPKHMRYSFSAPCFGERGPWAKSRERPGMEVEAYRQASL